MDDFQIEVFTTQEGVAIRGQDFKLMLTINLCNFDNRYVERAAAKVKYDDCGVATFLIHAVGERCRGRLIDDAFDIETRNLAGIFGCLALRVIEVGRDGYHGFRHFFAQVVFGRFLHLHENAGGDLRRRHSLAIRLYPGVTIVGTRNRVRHHLDVALHDVVFETTADQAFNGKQRVRRIRHSLPFGRLTDKHLIVFTKCDNRRRRSIAL